jgi:glutaredoxin
MKLFRTALLLLLLVLPCLVNADIVSYIDERGRKHYVDSLERVPEQYRPAAEASKPLPKINKFNFQLDNYGNPAASIPSGSVELYLTSWCGYCKAAESYLKEKKVSYKRFDIEKDPSAKKVYDRIGNGGIPVIRIGSQVLQGFDPAELERALQ